MTGTGGNFALFAAKLIADATVYVVDDRDASFAAMSMALYRELPASIVAQLRPFDTLPRAVAYAAQRAAQLRAQS